MGIDCQDIRQIIHWGSPYHSWRVCPRNWQGGQGWQPCCCNTVGEGVGGRNCNSKVHTNLENTMIICRCNLLFIVFSHKDDMQFPCACDMCSWNTNCFPPPFSSQVLYVKTFPLKAHGFMLFISDKYFLPQILSWWQWNSDRMAVRGNAWSCLLFKQLAYLVYTYSFSCLYCWMRTDIGSLPSTIPSLYIDLLCVCDSTVVELSLWVVCLQK